MPLILLLVTVVTVTVNFFTYILLRGSRKSPDVGIKPCIGGFPHIGGTLLYGNLNLDTLF